MRKLKILITAFTLLLTLPSMYADTGGNQDNTIQNKAVLNQDNKPSKRPNAPSRVYIECYYGDGFIEFILPEDIYYLSVRVYNEEEEWTGSVTLEEPTIYLPSLTGEYKVECLTDNGTTFSGVIIF